MRESDGIHPVTAPYLKEALSMVWQVFLEFEAPGYSREGIDEFRSYITVSNISRLMENNTLFLFGYFYKGNVVGLIAMAPHGHISLLFVNKNYHKKGIAKSLYKKALSHLLKKTPLLSITVNSSPYAVPIYKRMGFVPIKEEQTVHGIRFVPMKHNLTE